MPLELLVMLAVFAGFAGVIFGPGFYVAIRKGLCRSPERIQCPLCPRKGRLIAISYTDKTYKCPNHHEITVLALGDVRAR